MNNILLVDGMALLFRGFYATAFRRNFMENEQGIPTNGIFQFMRYFSDAVQTFRPTHVICCWDMGKETFRTNLYPAYKANRDDPPKELVPQFELVKKAMAAYNIPNIGFKEFEADDCIGTLAENFKTSHQITILSGDQDFRQLVDRHVRLALMLKGQGNYRLYTLDNFQEKTGILPNQVVEMKGLMGDSADNYPGVKGIGEKTALRLIQTYGSIQQILDNLDQLTKHQQKRIREDLEMLYLSKQLATIKRDIPIELSIDNAVFAYDETEVKKRLTNLGLDHVFV